MTPPTILPISFAIVVPLETHCVLAHGKHAKEEVERHDAPLTHIANTLHSHLVSSISGDADDVNKPQYTVSLYLGLLGAEDSEATRLQQLLATPTKKPASRNGEQLVNCLVHAFTDGLDDMTTVWSTLGDQAFKDGADYVLFWRTAEASLGYPKWPSIIHQEFATLAQNMCQDEAVIRHEEEIAETEGHDQPPPYHHQLAGFGCLAILAENRPRWDLNPVLHRTHYNLMGGHVFLPEIEAVSKINQPDRFLYYAYARLNAARVAKSLGLLLSLSDHDLQQLIPTAPQKAFGWSDAAMTIMMKKLSGHLDSFSAILQQPSPPSLDVVVPSYRVDMHLLKGICKTEPANQGTVSYIIVDNPANKASRNISRMQQDLTLCKPAIVRVNPVNSGVTYSRNRGIESSRAEWIVFQDDDVVPNADLLQAYTAAITKHVHDDPPPLAFIGMIHFLEPFNGFTSALRMAGVANAFEIAELTTKPVWGCTANVCVRNGPWLRFIEAWPKDGGGEDIDFFLRLQDIGPIIGVPTAAVTHPWWANGRRSFLGYWHFRLWGFGDGRLQQLHPERCYRSCPNIIETLAFVWLSAAVFLLLAACGYVGSKKSSFVSMAFAMLRALLLMSMGLIEVDMMGNVIQDRLFLRAVNSESLEGMERDMASMEGALILAACELGRFEHHLRHGRLQDLCKRFDFYCDALPHARRAWLKTYTLKFFGFVTYGILVQLCLATVPNILPTNLIWMTTTFHCALIAFLMFLFME